MNSYLLLGNDIKSYNADSALKDAFVEVYGDGINKIDCNSLKFKDNSNVKIFAHGNRISLESFKSILSPEAFKPFVEIGMNYVYSFSLCMSKTTSISFIDLSTISNNKAINFVLASCHGGTAINDIFLLPKWSTLITLNSPDHELVGPLGQEILIKSKDFAYQDNPFIQFVFYIFNNPDSNQFAIKHRSGVKIFKSSIDDFISNSKQNFAQEEIRSWQNLQLHNFINFCKEIKSEMNIIHSNNIQEFLNFVENNNNLLEQSSLDRYQELLIVSDISHGETRLLNSSENMNIMKDIKFLDGISLIFWAIKENNLVLLEKLIKSGVDVNSVEPNGLSALHYSIVENLIDITKLLVKEGADINVKNLDATALEVASYSNNYDAVLELLKVGAVADDIENDGLCYIMLQTISFVAFIISKLVNNEYYSDLIKIAEAELLFMRDPIEYILVHNDQAILASNAMDNLMLHKDLVEIYPEILKTKECLDQLPNGIIENLNNFCGRDHFIYKQNDL